MSWLFSQALVEEYSVDTSSDGEPSALLSGSHTQQAYCAPDKMTVFSRLSRFGMTYKPLTASRGEELLMSYRAAFHALTLVQREKAQELTESAAECGEKWHASFTKYDPNLSLWKTHQCSLLGDLEPFLETWPQWGLMRGGECWEQQTLAQTTSETASGLWPTPTYGMAKHAGLTAENSQKELERGMRAGFGMSSLAIAVQANWPTPDAHMGSGGRTGKTPPTGKRASGTKQQITLNDAVKWATPIARDWRSGKASQATHDKNSRPLSEQIGGSLNPMWVEWLMGWPLGWTDLKPLATDKSHSVQQQLGAS